MCNSFDIPQTHRQHRLRALERLYLAFLIHAQHQRLIGWVQIHADDIVTFSSVAGRPTCIPEHSNFQGYPLDALSMQSYIWDMA